MYPDNQQQNPSPVPTPAPESHRYGLPTSVYPTPEPLDPADLNEGWLQKFKHSAATISVIVAAPLVALFLTIFVFQSYQVDGPSMEGTLQDADRLIVLKLPKTVGKITNQPYIPSRSDIVIFSRPLTEEGDNFEERQLIKRVIGLPGDRVVVSEGSVRVYNSAFPGGYDPDKSGQYTIDDPETEGNIDITVGENRIFVLGDNRGNSLDSRSFGTVKSSDVVGKLWLRIYPFNKFNSF